MAKQTLRRRIVKQLKDATNWLDSKSSHLSGGGNSLGSGVLGLQAKKLGISTFFMDYLFIRGLKTKHSMLLIFLRSFNLIIFFVFVPISAFSFTGLPISGEIAQVLIFFLIGLVFWVVLMLMIQIRKIYKNLLPVMLIFFFPLIIFLLFLFIRLV